MSDPLILRTDVDGVTTLTLNRPHKLNALNPAVFVELRAELDAVAEDASVRCVVLTGSGRSFCAGHDLDAIAAHDPAPSTCCRLGADAVAWAPGDDDAVEWIVQFLRTRANSIGGGTSEIQRNVVGERVLGLPREPDPYHGAPWREVPRS